ncbi:hypothetical protein HK098_000332 [Nowakowskiella sp. JEL0407]|nr:hypothetical protein HK098_000332 [Nowakowskiella sp. JEL0407]
MASETLASIFTDVARTTSTHRRSAANMRKLLLGINSIQKKQQFYVEFVSALARILSTKPSDSEARRVVEFLIAELPDSVQDATDSLITFTLKTLVPGLRSKDKNVRFRVAQIVAVGIRYLNGMSDDFCHLIESHLITRIRDKDAAVRYHIARALCFLETFVEDNDAKNIQKALETMLQDPSGEVRHAVLASRIWDIVGKIQLIVPHIRDVYPSARVEAYTKLAQLINLSTLRFEEREYIIKSGLGDRDKAVRTACVTLLRSQLKEVELIPYLESFDVVNSKELPNVIEAFLENDLRDFVPDINWDELTGSLALFMRCYAKFCKKAKDEEKLESVMPTLTQHADNLKMYMDAFDRAEKKMRPEIEFVVDQLLQITEYLDFDDEIGKKHLLEFLREKAHKRGRHQRFFPAIIKIFKKLSFDDFDFSRNVVDIIYSLADENDGKPLDLKSHLLCLRIIKCYLQLSETSLTENTLLGGLLRRFIIPALESDQDDMTTIALECMGLIGCLDKNFAKDNIKVFLHVFNDAPEEVQLKALQILLDLMTLHGDILTEEETSAFISVALESDVYEILECAIYGSCKLFLLNVLKNEELLLKLLHLYFGPITIDQPAIQQCMTYFFPTFAYSSAAHMTLLSKVAVNALCTLTISQEDNEEMVSPAVIAQHLAEWTDPRRLLKPEVNLSTHVTVALNILQRLVEHSSDASLSKILFQMLGGLYLGADLKKAEVTEILFWCQNLQKNLFDGPSFNEKVKKISVGEDVEADEIEAVVEPANKTGSVADSEEEEEEE